MRILNPIESSIGKIILRGQAPITKPHQIIGYPISNLLKSISDIISPIAEKGSKLLGRDYLSGLTTSQGNFLIRREPPYQDYKIDANGCRFKIGIISGKKRLFCANQMDGKTSLSIGKDPLNFTKYSIETEFTLSRETVTTEGIAPYLRSARKIKIILAQHYDEEESLKILADIMKESDETYKLKKILSVLKKTITVYEAAKEQKALSGKTFMDFINEMLTPDYPNRNE
ncbi:hypothetical protein A2526_01765 [candidate division WOR-1 bacterium RIFOXYD2_FULL_36_8]|uniref:Uncharacterized protein n=1 Tax=candidate division WOR-1 bacterium RIFOXYB2_FULL_36_35 TaxID=1802578 RepID=A0A1F4S401_UNCSA|nr:MAG: hypothetical protein A2230_02945 [candidate division WOR-1 bacterium RIFOXYA2_FULL_36_21]OGC15138.1 MAG: hypothetical protein A2282_08995 [candidate division WOR-1 bacterium RIFOXYA12_FULL_36_13]OGC15162.1 MAG: hypothetical protein A2290_08855 [candidate division WOR-1 bacterium RIFOXYB2_FULL_36_35]OGC41833.1 MAG: hypothetical protein A2526_01765 [candidate division WOR-1 bacterium RIFOXYD2_FULL_36_8]